MPEDRRITVAVTGAGGVGVSKRLLAALQEDDRVTHVDLLVSANGRKLAALEFGTREDPDSVAQALGAASPKVCMLDPADLSGSVTRGSYPSDAMVILPCAAGVLGRIAHGLALDLIERAADVTLKERRRLVLLARETPLSTIHLENLLALSRMGATILPPVLTFYNDPATVADAVEHIVARTLDQFGLELPTAHRWTGMRQDPRRAATTGDSVAAPA